MPVARAFLAVATQWNVIPMAKGGAYWVGLNYAGVEAGLRGEEIALSGEQWAGLRIMEAAARNALNGIRVSGDDA